MEAAATMDFHALSRRELQALCKRNGVRANMTNAAMADALQGLTSVDGIDEIGTTLCLPTPGRSAMKSAAVAGAEQQHGSPLPRGRRVSVISPAAIRMDVEEGDDELKRDLVKKIVKTPGVALRSTSRRARATPAPLPTPATLRRSQRTSARKAAAPVEAENRVEEVSTAKRTTSRASVRSKMMVDLDQEEEVAVATPKVQQEEPKDLASDVKCNEPEEEDEVTKLLEGDNKEEEPQEGDEADSSDATNGSALLSDKSRAGLKVEEVVAVEQVATKPQEGTVEEQEPISVQKLGPVAPTEDSPILGVLSKAGATESVIGISEDASVEDGGGVAEWPPVTEMIVETNDVEKDGVEAISEVAVKRDDFTITNETVHSPKEILRAATGEDVTSEEDLTEVRTDFDNVKELVQMMQGTEIAVKANDNPVEEASEDDGDEESTEDDGSVDEEASEDDGDEESTEDDGSVDEEASEDDVSADEDASEDGSAEEDDFTSDLLSDAETVSVTTSPVKENQVAIASATRVSVKSLDDSPISVTNEEEVSEEKDVIEEAMKEIASTVDTIVKSLDEGTHQADEEKLNTRVEAVGQKDYSTMSMRKLRATLKNQLAMQEGKKRAEAKRLPLEEVDDNACADC